jgi:hypothetical protein
MDEARLAEVEYMKQLNKFSRTIDAKSDHKRNVIINRIRESLRSEYEMLHHVEKRDNISSEIVISILRRVFNKLESEGIKFEF